MSARGVVRRARRRRTLSRNRAALLSLNWKTSVYKVLKQVHPDLGLTKYTMEILNSFVYDMLRRITFEALQVSQLSTLVTLNARDVQTAVQLALNVSQELAKHAASEGLKAVNKFVASRTASKRKTTSKRKHQTFASRAGVQFQVPRVLRFLKSYLAGGAPRRVSLTSAVYLAAVIEYLVAEVLELAGNHARDKKRRLITPRHVMLAVRNDDDLDSLTTHVTFPRAGVAEFIHPRIGGPVPATTVVSKRNLAPPSVAPIVSAATIRANVAAAKAAPRKKLARKVDAKAKAKPKSKPKTPVKKIAKSPRKVKTKSVAKSGAKGKKPAKKVIKKKIKIKKKGAAKVSGKKKATKAKKKK